MRTQNSSFENHPRDILRDKNHLYGIVIVHILDHSKLKYSNFIGYLQVSKSCRSLVYVSIDPCLWGNTKHDDYTPVTLAMHGRLTG